MTYCLSDFDFELPQEHIALAPASPRESAKLLHVAQQNTDYTIADLPDLLEPGDLLVINNTKVIPARLYGKRGDASIEVTLHKQIGMQPIIWRCFAKPAKKCREGDIIDFGGGLQAHVTGRLDAEVLLEFKGEQEKFWALLDAQGQMPLPPYIAKQRAENASDKENYQTIFAKAKGAVAAPTAGLHFTPSLLAAFKARNIQTTAITLHVGGGTFLPVKEEDIAQHVMHSEWIEVNQNTVDAIQATKVNGNKVIAVGTTVLRALESAAIGGTLQPFQGETDIFITPPYDFKVVDRLLTNFHLPKSTLFMLVSAFSGLERMQQAYQHAVAHNYRFFSYGDACLLDHA